MEDGEADDYMGDLSRFLPSSQAPASNISHRKAQPTAKPSRPKKPTAKTRQEQRRNEKERQQREEDEQTVAGMETAIPESNVGFKLLQRMGYRPGGGLGRGGEGTAAPVGVEIRRGRAGLGREDPAKEKERMERERGERKRARETELSEEFGCRQRSQWRVRRVIGDFHEAQAVLSGLEDRVDLDAGDGEGEEKNDEEEEEEIITEEDLLEVLVKLRDAHHYCLYCGCQYDSVEALLTNCPGVSEEDH